MPTDADIAGIVLCGGHSKRMGFPKAWLPFGEEVLLQRVVRILGECTGPIVAVAAADQELPELPAEVRIVRDRRDSEGPLEGVGRGLTALRHQAKRAFVTSCDAPFLATRFVSTMAEWGTGYDLCIAGDESFWHPLAAVYATHLATTIEQLLEAGKRRPVALMDCCRTRRIAVEDLRGADPQLHTLHNLNNPHAYIDAMRELGLEIPAEIRRTLSID